LKELISDNYEKVANNVKEDTTTLQKIQNKIEEFNNYLKDEIYEISFSLASSSS
jgi:hypothetical protein